VEPRRDQIIRLVEAIRPCFIWIILGSYVVAALLPELGIWIRGAGSSSGGAEELELGFSLPVLMLAVVLFNAGLGVKPGQLRQLAQQPSVLFGGLGGNLLVPLAFILLLSMALKSWHRGPDIQQVLVGLAIVASMPIAGSSTAWAQNANGDLTLSLGLILLTTALSPLLAPAVLHAVGFLTRGDYAEDLHQLASGGVGSFLGTRVILPALLGIAARSVAGIRRMATAEPYIKLTNYGVLILLNYTNGSLALPGMLATPDLDLLTLIVLTTSVLGIVTFAAGFLIARLFRTNRSAMVSLIFGLGMNNNGTGLVLASIALAAHPQVMLPIIAYNLVQNLLASVVDHELLRRDLPVEGAARF
jgi:BASS family bile acid:Na+ symporter